VNEKILKKAFGVLEIDEFGLDHADRQYLKILCEKYKGGPVGLETMAATMVEDPDSIENVIEPFLMQLGLVKRTKQGRVAIDKAFGYLGLTA